MTLFTGKKSRFYLLVRRAVVFQLGLNTGEKKNSERNRENDVEIEKDQRGRWGRKTKHFNEPVRLWREPLVIDQPLCRCFLFWLRLFCRFSVAHKTCSVGRLEMSRLPRVSEEEPDMHLI